jgi:hypothetical protein
MVGATVGAGGGAVATLEEMDSVGIALGVAGVQATRKTANSTVIKVLLCVIGPPG